MSIIAYVFPGQGSQSVGMLCDFAKQNPLINDVFNMASERLGYDLWQLVQQGPADRLNQTEYTQAAMLVADVAIYRVLQERDAPQAMIMAGHSLGEYAALVCAGAIDLADAAELTARRGRLMQESIPLGQGAMAAIVGLTDVQVDTLCTASSTTTQVVTPANYNAIGQVVIAGHTPAVEKAILLAVEMGALLARLIPVSVPCHCSLLYPAAQQFADALQAVAFKIPEIPVISNVDLSVYDSAEHIRRLLKAQLYQPVRWVETIQLMKAKGVDLIIECGPGKVLSGLTKRIDKSLRTISVNDQQSLEDCLIV